MRYVSDIIQRTPVDIVAMKSKHFVFNFFFFFFKVVKILVEFLTYHNLTREQSYDASYFRFLMYHKIMIQYLLRLMYFTLGIKLSR